MTNQSAEVAPRRMPVQARSRERVKNILTHAANIINSAGVDGTSMSAIARQSDMSLASLYRYFPNKAAIVQALAELHVKKMEQVLQAKLAEADVDDAVDVLIDLFSEFYRSEPAYSAIWSGVESMPELRELDLQELYMNAGNLDAWLRNVYPEISSDRRWTASILLPRSVGTILRLAITLPDSEAGRLIQELKCMTRVYIAQLAGDHR